MSDPVEGFALLAAELGLGTYAVTGPSSIFLEMLRPTPDLALAVTSYAGGESDTKLPYDEIYLQWRVRGPANDTRAGRALVQAVYDRLHGLGMRTLPNGVAVQDVIGLQSGPVFIGPDANGRPEWTVNFRAELYRPGTGNRH